MNKINGVMLRLFMYLCIACGIHANPLENFDELAVLVGASRSVSFAVVNRLCQIASSPTGAQKYGEITSILSRVDSGSPVEDLLEAWYKIESIVLSTAPTETSTLSLLRVAAVRATKALAAPVRPDDVNAQRAEVFFKKNREERLQRQERNPVFEEEAQGGDAQDRFPLDTVVEHWRVSYDDLQFELEV